VLGAGRISSAAVPAVAIKPPLSTRAAARSSPLRPIRVLGLGALAAHLLIVAIIVVGAAGRSFKVVPSVTIGGSPRWLTGPLHGVSWWTFGPSNYTLWLEALFVAYVAVVVCSGNLPSRLLLWVSVAAQLPWLLAPPLVSTDVVTYVTFGRLGTAFGLNPYASPPRAAPSNPLLPFHDWHNLTTPYGPLFTALSYPISAVGAVAGYWLMKALMVGAAVTCVGLVWRLARARRSHPGRTVAFMALNPVWLVIVVGGFHNDLLMMAIVLAGSLLVVSRREISGIVTLALAVAIKYAAVLVLPFAVLGSSRRREALFAAVAAGAVLAAASFAAFGGALVNGLQVAGDTATFYRTWLTGPAEVGHLLGYSRPPAAVDTAMLLFAAAVIALMLVRTWRGSDWIACAGWATLAALSAATFLGQWYLSWLLPLAAVGRSRLLRVVTVIVCGYVVLNPMYLTHLPHR